MPAQLLHGLGLRFALALADFFWPPHFEKCVGFSAGGQVPFDDAAVLAGGVEPAGIFRRDGVSRREAMSSCAKSSRGGEVVLRRALVESRIGTVGGAHRVCHEKVDLPCVFHNILL